MGTWIKGVYEKDYLLKEYPYGECALLYSKKAVKRLKSLVAKYKSEKATKVKSNAGKVVEKSSEQNGTKTRFHGSRKSKKKSLTGIILTI